MKYEDEFTAWLYANVSIPNGDVLIQYLEDGYTYDAFLSEMGLEDE
jgi:hypothetical protein